MVKEQNRRLGAAAVKRGMVSPDQLACALEEWEQSSRRGEKDNVGQIFVRRGWITTAQLCELLQVEDEHALVPDRYQILEEVGRGGMAVVYRARDQKLSREVVLKAMRSEVSGDERSVGRMLREAQAIAKLNHPNIVRLYDVISEGKTPCLVMEYVRGVTLDQVIYNPTWTRESRLALLADVAGAVHAAHEKGVIHRDLKPSNIMIETHPPGAEGAGDGPKPPRAVVMDFGLAHLTGSDAQLTRTKTIMGTPQYMAPEQLLGRADEIDARTDVYALGVILYETLCGRPPFTGEEASHAISRRELGAEAPAPRRVAPDVPAALETVCLRAMAREPRDRYPSAGALRDDLRRYLAGEEIAARPLGLVTRVGRRLLRRRAAVAAAALIAALGGGIALLAGSVREKQERLEGAELHLVAERHATTEARETLTATEESLREARREAEEESARRREAEDRRRQAERVYFPALQALQRLEGQPDGPSSERDAALRDALGALREALRVDAGFAAAWRESGRAHSLAGDLARALECFARALELEGGDALTHFHRGRLWMREYQSRRRLPTLAIRDGRPQLEAAPPETREAEDLRLRAARDFEAAARLSPEAGGWEALFGRGLLHLYQGDYAAADAMIRASLDVYGTNPEAHFYRGLARLFASDVDGACEELDRAARTGMATFEVLAYQGLAHLTARGPGHLGAAMEAWDRALALRPGSPELASYRSFAQPIRAALDLSHQHAPEFASRFAREYLAPLGHQGVASSCSLSTLDWKAFNLVVLHDGGASCPYTPEDLAALGAFVEEGGGLLLVGAPGTEAVALGRVAGAFGMEFAPGAPSAPAKVLPRSGPRLPASAAGVLRWAPEAPWAALAVEGRGEAVAAVRECGKGRVAAVHAWLLDRAEASFFQQLLLWLAARRAVAADGPAGPVPPECVRARGHLRVRHSGYLAAHAKAFEELSFRIEQDLESVTGLPPLERRFTEVTLLPSGEARVAIEGGEGVGAWHRGFPALPWGMYEFLARELAGGWAVGEPLGRDGLALYLSLEAARRSGFSREADELRKAAARAAEALDPDYTAVDLSRPETVPLRAVYLAKPAWIWDRLREKFGDDLLPRYLGERRRTPGEAGGPGFTAAGAVSLLSDLTATDLFPWFQLNGIRAPRPGDASGETGP